jgi:hypothetical protein
MAWKKRQRCPLKLKSYNKTILYQNKTWHVVHEQDGMSFAVQELRKGVTGGIIVPFAPKGWKPSLQQDGCLATQRKDVIFI